MYTKLLEYGKKMKNIPSASRGGPDPPEILPCATAGGNVCKFDSEIIQNSKFKHRIITPIIPKLANSPKQYTK